MPDKSYLLQGLRAFECASEGPLLRSERDAVDIIGGALSQRASLVVIPVARLADDFFSLRTRIAGEIIQKFVNYGLRLVIVGDIARHVDASEALRDFVFETNRGRQVWFLPDMAELESRLAAG
ncbi:MAG: DUF4180 domain-containing protein [Rhizomicrobium sp.]